MTFVLIYASFYWPTLLCPLDYKYFFKFLANACKEDLCITLIVSCFSSLANPIQNKYLFHKPFIMSHRTIYRSHTSNNSVEEWLEFELFQFIYTSLSCDWLSFEFIGFYTGCNHKQMPYKDIMAIKGYGGKYVLWWLAYLHILISYYQTYGSVRHVHATYKTNMTRVWLAHIAIIVSIITHLISIICYKYFFL